MAGWEVRVSYPRIQQGYWAHASILVIEKVSYTVAVYRWELRVIGNLLFYTICLPPCVARAKG
jgi:hypothetical protein